MTKAAGGGRVPTVARRYASFPVVMMLCLVLGLHWTFLRTVGWVNMFASFAQTGTVHEALVKTFDGSHPCSMCKFVKNAKHGEKKEQSINPDGKLNLMLTVSLSSLNPPTAYTWLLPLRDNTWLGRTEAPPLPPPRAA
ncbi:MAG: hypothetical protein U1G07_17265 [Verrucomicrobiota bacterium]